MPQTQTIEELKQGKKNGNRLTISEGDYKLRDKKKEREDSEKQMMNSRDITAQHNKYADEIKRVKAEARAEAQEELMSSEFIANLTAKIKEELQAEQLKAEKSVPEPSKEGKETNKVKGDK